MQRFDGRRAKAFDLAKEIASFKAATIASKKRALENQLADILGAATECDLARQLQAKIVRAREQRIPPASRALRELYQRPLLATRRKQRRPPASAGAAPVGAETIGPFQGPMVLGAQSDASQLNRLYQYRPFRRSSRR
jgi:hypothetical protein